MAVAHHLYMRFGWDSTESFSVMKEILAKQGRGAIFNQLLLTHGIVNKKEIHDCLKVYRHHTPSLSLFFAAKELLLQLEKPLYLVTDGHKVVQHKKIQALGLEPMFSKIFITHRYGLQHAKPSIYCFEKIRQIHQCRWEDMAYIGDNPAKDFVNLTPLGVHTVRVLTGEHKNIKAPDGFEAQYVIDNLSLLPSIIKL